MSDLTGRCLCGAVRYRARGPALSVSHCHCSMCRRAGGAAMVTWVGFARDGFAFTKGELVRNASSDFAWRGFCGACGAQILFDHVAPNDRVFITAGTLDDPEAVTPECHIHADDRLSWQPIDDGLPRFPGSSGDLDT